MGKQRCSNKARQVVNEELSGLSSKKIAMETTESWITAAHLKPSRMYLMIGMSYKEMTWNPPLGCAWGGGTTDSWMPGYQI